MSAAPGRSGGRGQHDADSAAAAPASGNRLSQASANRGGPATGRAKKQPQTYATITTTPENQQRFSKEGVEFAQGSIHLPYLDDMVARVTSWDQPGDKQGFSVAFALSKWHNFAAAFVKQAVQKFEQLSRANLQEIFAKLSQLTKDILELKDHKEQLIVQNVDNVADINELQEIIERLEDELAQQKAQYSMLVQRHKQELSALEKRTMQQVAYRDTQVQALQEQLQEIASQLQSNEQELAAKDAQHAKQLADKDAELQQLRQDRDSQLQSKDQELEQLRSEVHQLQRAHSSSGSEASQAQSPPPSKAQLSSSYAELYKRHERMKGLISGIAGFAAQINSGDFDVDLPAGLVIP